AGSRAAVDGAGLAGPADAGAAADAVDAAVTGQAVGAGRTGLSEPLQVSAQVGLWITDGWRLAVGVHGARGLASGRSITDVGVAVARRRGLTDPLAVAGSSGGERQASGRADRRRAGGTGR